MRVQVTKHKPTNYHKTIKVTYTLTRLDDTLVFKGAVRLWAISPLVGCILIHKATKLYIHS